MPFSSRDPANSPEVADRPNVKAIRRVAVLVTCAVLTGCGQQSTGHGAAARHQPGRQDSDSRPAAHRPTAFVYRGPAAKCDACSEAAATLLHRSARHFRVVYVGPGEKRKITTASLRGAALYVQPGGNGSVASAAKALGKPAAGAIRQYVAAGGRYLGICMGAYLAGSDPGIGLLDPGNTGEYDVTRGASVRSARDAVIPVRWNGHTRLMFAQDAPYIVPGHTKGERVISRFSNGKVNALVRPLGRGAVAVVGTHPEAGRTWYSQSLWHEDRDGLDYRYGLQLVNDLMSTGRSVSPPVADRPR